MSLKLAISGARDFEDAQRRVSRELRDSGYSGTVIRRNSGKSRAALWHGTRHGHLALVKNGNRVSLHGCVEVPRAWRANPGQRVDVRLNGLRSDFVSGPDLVPRHGNPADLVLPRKAKQGDMVAGINVWLMPLGSVVMDPSTASGEVAVVNGVPNMYGLSVGEKDWLEADIYADGNKSFEVLAVGVSKDWDDPVKFAKAARKALEGRKAPSRGRRKGKAAPEAPTPARKAPKATSTAPKRSRGRPASVTHDDVLQALQRAGRGSATTIAKALGVTRDATGRALNALYADGRIERTVKGRGHTFWPLGGSPAKAAPKPKKATKPKPKAAPKAKAAPVESDLARELRLQRGGAPRKPKPPAGKGPSAASMVADLEGILNPRRSNGWSNIGDPTVSRTYDPLGPKEASDLSKLARAFGAKASNTALRRGSAMRKVKVTFKEHSYAASAEAFTAFARAHKKWDDRRTAANRAWHSGGPDTDNLDLLEGLLPKSRGRTRRRNPVAYADLPADARSIIEDAARNDYGLSKAQATKLLGLLRDALLQLPESPPPAKLAGAVLKLMSKWSTEMKTAGAKASGPIKAAKGEISDEEAIQAIQSAVRKLLAA